MNDNQAVEDFGAFTAPDPAVAEANKKAKEKAQEAAAKKNAMPKGSQKEIDKMMEKTTTEKEAGIKSQLLQQISDYQKHIREYFPERVEFIKVPKNLGPKNTVEELRVYVKDLENELGKKGALDVIKGLWVKGFEFFETFNEGQRFGLNVSGIGQVAKNSIAPRMIPQTGETIPGPAVPTLAEFSIKYASWFSTSVEARMVMMVFEIVTGVHRMNTQVTDVQKAATKETSKETKDLMNKL